MVANNPLVELITVAIEKSSLSCANDCCMSRPFTLIVPPFEFHFGANPGGGGTPVNLG